jgi:predicted nucleotidyltransferase
MSIGSALFGPAQALVLAKLFDQPLRAYHVNELMRATGLGSASLQRELKRLEAGGLIFSEQIGNLRRVRANERSPLFGELAAIVRKTLGTDAVLREALRSVDRRIVFALVYGSVASGSDRSDSDIDLMIVGDDVGLGDVMPALLDAEARLGRRISPTCYTSASFERMRADPKSFVSQVLRSPTRVLMGKIGEPVAT